MSKFFHCKICGNLIGKIIDSKVVPVCCGQPMTELIANTEEASVEKHLPIFEVRDSIIEVRVGSIDHPMEAGHNISFIYLESARGGQRKTLAVGDEPKASFSLVGDEAVAIYAYCNLHGLWKTDI